VHAQTAAGAAGVTPYYDHGGITIYHGDCREILRSTPIVEAVVTDPPYGIGFSGYASHNDDPKEYQSLIHVALVLSEASVRNGWCVWFQSATTVRDWSARFDDRPFRLVAYPKTFTQILKNIGPIYSTDYALFWPIGEPSTPRGNGRDWCVANTSDMSRRFPGHPCNRPIDQMLHAVTTFSTEGETVLDPFMGSGTTLVAAKQLGRRAIGIEIEERYCEIAAKRLQQEVLPLAPREPEPTQVDMLSEAIS
jgi:site-specific DNA-methyltransferase (adenine-specific)